MRCIWSDAVLVCTEKISLITNQCGAYAPMRCIWSDAMRCGAYDPMRCEAVHMIRCDVRRCIWSDCFCCTKKISLITNRCDAYGPMLFLYKKDQFDYKPMWCITLHMVRCHAMRCIWSDATNRCDAMRSLWRALWRTILPRASLHTEIVEMENDFQYLVENGPNVKYSLILIRVPLVVA